MDYEELSSNCVLISAVPVLGTGALAAVMHTASCMSSSKWIIVTWRWHLKHWLTKVSWMKVVVEAGFGIDPEKAEPLSV